MILVTFQVCCPKELRLLVNLVNRSQNLLALRNYSIDYLLELLSQVAVSSHAVSNLDDEISTLPEPDMAVSVRFAPRIS